MDGDAHAHAGGLANLGGTCYLNAALQLLRATGLLQLRAAAGPAALVPELREVFAHLDAGRTVAPHGLLRSLQSLAGPGFRVQQPNDVHEIYVKLVEWATASPTEAELRAPAALDEPARNAWSACLRGTQGDLAPDLYGLLRRDVRCGRCDAMYVNHETFSALELDLPPGPDALAAALEDVLTRHFAERDLNDGGGTWRCDRCGVTGGPALTRASLVHAPTVLTFAMNRYGGPGRHRGIAFPPAFELTLTGGRYRCAGAAMHSGGHCYAATARQGDGRWAIYDDQSVTEIAGAPCGSPDIQLLTYARMN